MNINHKKQMETVDELCNDIIEKLRNLTNLNVLTIEDCIKIIRIITDGESKWFMDNFPDMEIYEFMSNSRII